MLVQGVLQLWGSSMCREAIWCLPLLLYTLHSETGSRMEPDIHHFLLDWLASEFPKILLSLPPQCEITGTCHHDQPFKCGFWGSKVRPSRSSYKYTPH